MVVEELNGVVVRDEMRVVWDLDKGNTQEIIIFGRVVRINGEGIKYEADPNIGEWCWNISGSRKGQVPDVEEQWG